MVVCQAMKEVFQNTAAPSLSPTGVVVASGTGCPLHSCSSHADSAAGCQQFTAEFVDHKSCTPKPEMPRGIDAQKRKHADLTDAKGPRHTRNIPRENFGRIQTLLLARPKKTVRCVTQLENVGAC